MRLFWELIKLGLQRQLSYRAANLAGLVTNAFFGLLRASLMIALYEARSEVSGISLQDAITYTGLTQAVLAFLYIFGWWEIIKAVYSGDIASDLLKPFDYYLFWLAQDIGRAIAHFVVRGLPLVFAYAILFRISTPTNLGQWLAVLVSLGLSLLVSFSWRFLVNMLAFWSPDARGIGRVAFSVSWFLSGFMMPLRFFPPWFSRICQLTPFPSMINTVMEVYLGVLDGPELFKALSMQLLWVVILFSIGQLMMHAGVRKLVIQGG